MIWYQLNLQIFKIFLIIDCVSSEIQINSHIRSKRLIKDKVQLFLLNLLTIASSLNQSGFEKTGCLPRYQNHWYFFVYLITKKSIYLWKKKCLRLNYRIFLTFDCLLHTGNNFFFCYSLTYLISGRFFILFKIKFC